MENMDRIVEVCQRLSEQPDNWHLRYEYAQYFEDADMMEECLAQRWMADNQKCPGPPCVQEAHPGEASWFSAENREDMKWSFPHYINANKLDRKWCLPVDIFQRLEGFITDRRDGGFHNKWAKSWNSRTDAELALAAALPRRKRKYRSIDDNWRPSGR